MNIRLAFLFLVLATPALAQTVVGTPSTVVGIGGFWDGIAPYILTTVSTIIMGIIGWLAALVQRWIGIKIEAQHREALHSALMTGVSAALARAGKTAAEAQFDTKSVIVAEAINWAQKSVPQAIAYFKLDEKASALTELALSKLTQLAESPSAASAQTTPSNAL